MCVCVCLSLQHPVVICTKQNEPTHISFHNDPVWPVGSKLTTLIRTAAVLYMQGGSTLTNSLKHAVLYISVQFFSPFLCGTVPGMKYTSKSINHSGNIKWAQKKPPWWIFLQWLPVFGYFPVMMRCLLSSILDIDTVPYSHTSTLP